MEISNLYDTVISGLITKLQAELAATIKRISRKVVYPYAASDHAEMGVVLSRIQKIGGDVEYPIYQATLIITFTVKQQAKDADAAAMQVISLADKALDAWQYSDSPGAVTEPVAWDIWYLDGGDNANAMSGGTGNATIRFEGSLIGS